MQTSEITEYLAGLLDQPADHVSSREPEVKELALANPVAFQQAVLDYLKKGAAGPGKELLVKLLHGMGLLLELLRDPEKTSLEDAVSLAHLSKRNILLLDVSLAQAIREQPSAQQTDRILCILLEIAESNRVLPLLVPLLRLHDPKLRSKAALVFTRFSPSCMFSKDSLFDDDPRVRSNVIEALWGRDERWARSALQAALRDSDNRVRANAALGLHKLRDPAGLPVLTGMAEDPDPQSRASAAWAMGETRDQQCLPALKQLSEDSDDIVREQSVQAISKIES